jgi:16S rRNA (cytosine967-C5)-methyltransferase
MPAWLTDEWSRRKEISGWNDPLVQRFLKSQLKPARLHLRYAPGRAGELAREAWLEQGGSLEAVLPGVWAAHGKVSVFETEAWKKGVVSIQDAASFEAARLVEPLPGQTVWDVCAGRGGKTSVLAEKMLGKGALWATDIAPHKLTDLKRRITQAGWQNVRIQAWDGQKVPAFTIEVAKKGGFDRILVDAPCSASGTWRRDPDARFRVDPSSLSELEAKQDGLLALAWGQLRPGGVLTYVTCSWLPRENEDRVAYFESKTAPQALRIRQQLLGLPDFDANTMFVAQWRKPS